MNTPLRKNITPTGPGQVKTTYRNRQRRLYRLLHPPRPVYHNPTERRIEPSLPWGKWNLYIGGAGSRVNGFLNFDLIPLPGVDIAGDVQRLPFGDGVFSRVECDAVLEHVVDPATAITEIYRCLSPGGVVHLVVPFCHPRHDFPRDYWRFSPEGLKTLLERFEILSEGWRTGPTATMLTLFLEYAKIWFKPKWLKRLVYFGLGWSLFLLRYLDAFLLKSSEGGRLGNHYFLYARKPGPPPPAAGSPAGHTRESIAPSQASQ